MAITAIANLSDADAGWGTISYGGYTLPGLRDVKVTGEDVLDRAGRTVTHVRYLARVHFFVIDANEAAHKTTMEGLRRLLQEAGGILVFTGQGIGDLTINGAPPAVADVEWGPKPRIIEFTQVGGVCTEVVWEIVFAIKHTASANFGRFLAFNYTVDWDYDEAGVCTRVINGYLQVPLTRQLGQQPPAVASADVYRDQIDPKVPPGFARRPRRFGLSSDRATLEFSITDVQLQAEAPPPNCLRAELDYEIENIPPGFARYSASLGGPIETPVGTPTIRAAEAFVRIMIDKFAKLKKATGTKGVVIPVRVRFGRTLGTRTSTFGMSWLVTGCLDDLLKHGGIWEPIETSNWPTWAESMRASGAWGNRGNSGLVFSAADDAIVDLNYIGNVPPMGTGGGKLPGTASGTEVFKLDGLNEKNSWLAYENTLEAQRTFRSTAHRFIETFAPTPTSEGDVASEVGVTMAQGVNTTNTMVVQHQGGPVDHILMHGKAMRIKFKPAVPKLVTIAGKKVEEVKVRTDGPKAVACFFGETVYVVRWAILYRVVDGYLYNIPAKKNPALCCEENEQK